MKTTYEINNYVSTKSGNILKILNLFDTEAKLIDSDGIEVVLPYDYLYPIALKKDLMEKAGFTCIRLASFPLHVEYSYEVTINQKFYYVRCAEYKKEKVWTIGPFNIKSVSYTHLTLPTILLV